MVRALAALYDGFPHHDGQVDAPPLPNHLLRRGQRNLEGGWLAKPGANQPSAFLSHLDAGGEGRSPEPGAGLGGALPGASSAS